MRNTVSNLRNKIIRLAHEKPELRKHLLPLLSNEINKTAASVGFLSVEIQHLDYDGSMYDSEQVLLENPRSFEDAKYSLQKAMRSVEKKTDFDGKYLSKRDILKRRDEVTINGKFNPGGEAFGNLEIKMAKFSEAELSELLAIVQG